MFPDFSCHKLKCFSLKILIQCLRMSAPPSPVLPPRLSLCFLNNCVDLSHFSWSRPASPFMRSSSLWLIRRRGTDWERRTTVSKQSISSSGWPSGPLEKPSCCLSSASAKLCYSGVSSQRRKALWQQPPRTQTPGVPPEKKENKCH